MFELFRDQLLLVLIFFSGFLSLLVLLVGFYFLLQREFRRCWTSGYLAGRKEVVELVERVLAKNTATDDPAAAIKSKVFFEPVNGC